MRHKSYTNIILKEEVTIQDIYFVCFLVYEGGTGLNPTFTSTLLLLEHPTKHKEAVIQTNLPSFLPSFLVSSLLTSTCHV